MFIFNVCSYFVYFKTFNILVKGKIGSESEYSKFVAETLRHPAKGQQFEPLDQTADYYVR